MSLVTGHAVGPEGQHRVGLHLTHDLEHLRSPRRIERGLHVDVDRPLEEPVLLDAEDVEAATHLIVRTSAMRSDGQRSSSIEPPSPRVAVTSTTRFPACAATAMSPDER